MSLQMMVSDPAPLRRYSLMVMTIMSILTSPSPLCFLLFLFIYSSPSPSFSFLHYTLIVIINLPECKFRLLSCPQGCGENVPFLQHGKHMARLCVNRMAECPLKCGETMRYHYLKDHINQDCPRRTFTGSITAAKSEK